MNRRKSDSLRQRRPISSWASRLGGCCAVVLTLTAAAYAAPPLAPTATWPPQAAVLGSNRVDLTWAGSGHDRFEVHIGSFNAPTSANGWNSGEVAVSFPGTGSAVTPPLPAQQTWYVFIRLHNSDGWGPWSAPGRHFYVAGELPTEPWFIAGADGFQWPKAICYNPDRGEYLVAYNDKKIGQRWSISYWRLDGLGQKIGTEFTITTDTPLEGVHHPSIAYNSVNQEYYLAYFGWNEHPGLHDEIWGQRISAVTGAPIGPSQHYLDFPGILEIDVCHSPVSNVYLVAWHHNSGGQADVAALRIDAATAAPIGAYTNLTAASDFYSARPFLQFNPTTNEFMAGYQMSPSETHWDLDARIINAGTGAVGPTIKLAGRLTSEANGDLVWIPEQNRFLLVYEEFFTVWGQFVLPSGALVGERFRIDVEEVRGGVPRVAYNPQMSEFLVTWMAWQSAGNYARRITSSGTPLTEPFLSTGSVAGLGNWDPEPAWNPQTGEYLIAWFNAYDNVWVRRCKPYAAPAPDTTPPGPVTALTPTRYANAMGLAWTNPSTADFSGTLIRFKTTGYPTGPTDGTLVVNAGNAPSTSGSFDHLNLAPGTYYYAAFAYDEASIFAPAALAQARILPGDFDGDDDSDQSDFGHLQMCLSGDAMLYPSGCRDTDLDVDGDVDGQDMNVFLPCKSGAKVPPCSVEPPCPNCP